MITWSRQGRTLGPYSYVLLGALVLAFLWLAWAWGVDQRQLYGLVRLRVQVRPVQPRRQADRIRGIIRRGELDFARGLRAQDNPFKRVGMTEANAWWQGWHSASEARRWPELQPGEQGVLL
jgi:hypothetical protein